MKNYTITHQLDKQPWREFVQNHPRGTIFQTPEMYEVFAAATNYRPVLTAVKSADNGDILALHTAVIQRDLPGAA
ncbi:MAG: aminoacyltransferase, partial [bacterium]|nr:aminoacyltransferase [bacterium]